MDGNDSCMECESRKVEWASINLGIFLCEECSGRHRSLGTHVSQVRSLWLDAWSKETIEFFSKHGNKKAKQYYEATVPSFQVRPPQDQGPIVMEYWLRQKYEFKKFIKNENHINNEIKENNNNNNNNNIDNKRNEESDEKNENNNDNSIHYYSAGVCVCVCVFVKKINFSILFVYMFMYMCVHVYFMCILFKMYCLLE